MYGLDIEGVDKLFVSNRFATKKLLNVVKDYDYVIGIADHMKSAVRSRWDTKFTNRYGRRNILDNGVDMLESNWKFNLPEGMYEFAGTTNGPCNRSAYLVMDTILHNSLSTKFAFFHLCKKTWTEDLMQILALVV